MAVGVGVAAGVVAGKQHTLFTQGLPLPILPCSWSSQEGLAGPLLSPHPMEVERCPLSRGPVDCPGSPYSPGASLFFLAEGWQTRVHLLCPLSHDPTSASWAPLKPQAGVQALGIVSLHPVAHPSPAVWEHATSSPASVPLFWVFLPCLASTRFPGHLLTWCVSLAFHGLPSEDVVGSGWPWVPLGSTCSTPPVTLPGCGESTGPSGRQASTSLLGVKSGGV